MFLQPDLILLDTLTTFFSGLQSDSSLIDRLFPTRPPQERAEMREWFETKSVPVRLGYPFDATELPGVFIILGALSEPSSGQTIGEVLTDDIETPSMFTEIHGSHFSCLVRMACWTINANLTVWLQSLVTASLLIARENLNNQGLIEQKLGATDFEPLPQFFPSLAFRRDVSLSMTLPLAVPKDFGKIENIEVTATPITEPFPRIVVT